MDRNERLRCVEYGYRIRMEPVMYNIDVFRVTVALDIDASEASPSMQDLQLSM